MVSGGLYHRRAGIKSPGVYFGEEPADSRKRPSAATPVVDGGVPRHEAEFAPVVVVIVLVSAAVLAAAGFAAAPAPAPPASARSRGRRGHLPAVSGVADRQIRAAPQGGPDRAQPHSTPQLVFFGGSRSQRFDPVFARQRTGLSAVNSRPQLRPSRGRLGLPQLVLQPLAGRAGSAGSGACSRACCATATSTPRSCRTAASIPGSPTISPSSASCRTRSPRCRTPTPSCATATRAGTAALEPLRPAPDQRLHSGPGARRLHRQHVAHRPDGRPSRTLGPALLRAHHPSAQRTQHHAGDRDHAHPPPCAARHEEAPHGRRTGAAPRLPRRARADPRHQGARLHDHPELQRENTRRALRRRAHHAPQREPRDRRRQGQGGRVPQVRPTRRGCPLGRAGHPRRRGRFPGCSDACADGPGRTGWRRSKRRRGRFGASWSWW